MLRRVAIAIATAGGVGYAPVAPGTFGSAVGLAVYAALRLVRVPGAEIRGDRARLRGRRLGGGAGRAALRLHRPGPGRGRRGRRHARHAGVDPGRGERRAGRVRALPGLRRHQAVPRASARGAARRARHHGRRRGGGGVREPGAAPRAAARARVDSHDGPGARLCDGGDHRGRLRAAHAVQGRHQLPLHHGAVRGDRRPGAREGHRRRRPGRPRRRCSGRRGRAPTSWC